MTCQGHSVMLPRSPTSPATCPLRPVTQPLLRLNSESTPHLLVLAGAPKALTGDIYRRKFILTMEETPPPHSVVLPWSSHQ